MSNNNNMAEELIRLRETTGLNRTAFAELLGIPYRTITDWERGISKMPGYEFNLIEFRIKNDPMLSGKNERENDPNGIGSVMRGIEDQLEQNDNQLDGVINNLPKDETFENQTRESVIKKLKDCVKLLEAEKDRPQKELCNERELC